MRLTDRRWSTFAAGFMSLVLACAIALVAEQSPPKSAKAVPAAPQKPSPGEYVGNDQTCIDCHDTQSYKGTAHARAFKEKAPAANHGCESCHGPGKARRRRR